MKAKFIAIAFGILSAVSLKAQVNPWIPLMVAPPARINIAPAIPIIPVAPAPSIEFYRFNNGVTGSSNQIGGTTFYRFDNGVTGTSRQVGRSTYFDFSDGLSITGRQFGNSTYFDFSKLW